MRKALIVLGALLAAPFFFYPIFLAKVLCYALLASSFAFLFSATGLLSFGHAAFWGLGAYTTALSLKAGLSYELSLLLSLGVVLSYSFLLGISSIKRQGIYFSMITLAFAQIIYFIALKSPWTFGEDGIQGVPRQFLLFSDADLEAPMVLYYFTLFFVALAFYLLFVVRRSKFAFALKAIQLNSVRTSSLGISIYQHKLVALLISALLSGLAGSLKVFVLSQATLEDLTWHFSGAIVLMALMGGFRSFWGPGLGAFLLLLVQDQLAGSGSWILVIQGVVFVACVLFFSNGILRNKNN